MQKTIAVLHGPNLNLLGKRETAIYGDKTLLDLQAFIEKDAKHLGCKVTFFQSNIEGELVSWVHSAEEAQTSGLIINPGAFSHTSIALLDALLNYRKPIIEVHISNIYQRESFRHSSLTARAARGVIAGLGFQGYALALRALTSMEQAG